MSALVRSESAGLASAVETTFATQPTAGWRQHQYNGNGLKNFYPNIKRVRRQPITPNRADFKGDIIDLDATPAVDHDLNKDLIDYFGPGIFMVQPLYGGTTGATATGKFYPTGVTTSQFTVTAGGALVAGTLVFARGFTNAANNGLFVVQAASTSTAIKVTGTVLEAAPPANATVEVVGFQCASADIVAAATTLTSTALNWTTLNIPLYSWLWVGGGTAAAPGALGFATAADRGFIRATGITSTVLTFDRPTQTWSADTGTGKTIQIFFGWFVTNVAFTSTNYLETTYQFELQLPGLDSGAATDYIYSTGNFVDMWDLNGAAQNKIVSTLTFRGQDIQNPGTARATGASTALAPLAPAAFNTVTELPRLRIADKTAGGNYNASISVDIDTWKFALKNNVTPQKQQGFFGMKRGIVGRCNVNVDIKAFLVQNDMILAMRDNRDLMFEAAMRNNDAGIMLDLPRCEISGGATDYPLNGPVTIHETLNAVLGTVENFVVGMTVFPFLPAT